MLWLTPPPEGVAVKTRVKVPWSTFLGGISSIVAIAVLVPFNVSRFGLIVHVECGGPPAHVTPTFPMNPPSDVSVRVKTPSCPEGIVSPEGEALIVKSVPAPLKFTIWALPSTLALLSVNVSIPFAAPTAAGVKVICSVQLAPAAKGDAAMQLVLVPNGVLAPTPVIASGSVRGVLPWLVSVTG